MRGRVLRGLVRLLRTVPAGHPTAMPRSAIRLDRTTSGEEMMMSPRRVLQLPLLLLPVRLHEESDTPISSQTELPRTIGLPPRTTIFGEVKEPPVLPELLLPKDHPLQYRDRVPPTIMCRPSTNGGRLSVLSIPLSPILAAFRMIPRSQLH